MTSMKAVFDEPMSRARRDHGHRGRAVVQADFTVSRHEPSPGSVRILVPGPAIALQLTRAGYPGGKMLLSTPPVMSEYVYGWSRPVTAVTSSVSASILKARLASRSTIQALPS